MDTPAFDAQPAQRSLNARLAALERWAHADAREGTQAARTGLRQKFLDPVDPNGTLDPAERERRAERLRKAHYLRLAKKSAHARRKRDDKSVA